MKKVPGVYTHPKETYLSLEYTGSCGNIYQLFCNYIYISGNLDGAWWQQDGAAVHRNPAFMAELSEKFGGRVLAMGAERNGGVEWSTRSPDLNPLDFFLWGYLKSKVFWPKPSNLQQLGQNLERELNLLDMEMLRRSQHSMITRAAKYVLQGGGHFENS